MVDRPQPRRGEIWWAAVDKRRPVLVVQADFLNRSLLNWLLSVPLTSNLAFAEAPGNVRLSKREAGLSRPSVANVSQVAPLHRSAFRERVRPLPQGLVDQVSRGLRLVLDLHLTP